MKLRLIMKSCLPALLLPVLQVPTAFAHYIPTQENPTTVDASLVANWRSASLVGDYEYWQIPGTLMGGHAWPARKGVEIDEMNLSLAHRLDDNLFAVLKVGSHPSGGDGHGGVELEHAYVGWVCCESAGPWVVEAGQMSARFSPAIGEHAADRLMSETPLALDVFFGRHFHDKGIRFWWHETGGFSVGAEIWKGEAFPSTDSENGGAWDVFGRYKWQGEALSLEAGGWFYSASADARADHRYGGGHQHVPVVPPGQVSPGLFSDVRYTGDTEIVGVHGKLAYRVNGHWQLGVEAEWMQASLKGLVHTNTSQAALDATQSGGWIQPFVSWQRHTFGVRAEQVTTDNTLTGPAAPTLAANSGLANPAGHDPFRLTVGWRWQWRDNLALRAEAVRDETLLDNEQRVVLGVVWQQRVWPASGQSSGHHGH